MGMIKDTEGGNFGGYSEELGGGTPVGGHFGGESGRVGWDKRGRPGHREEQPRTNDGKFTYNSVNGKETVYDGRGKTVNPLLTGGKNGVYIDDVKDKQGNVVQQGVKSQFQQKSGSLYDQYKGKFYQQKSMMASKEGKKKYVIKLSANDIWECAKYSINAKTGEFDTSKSSKAQKAGLTAEAHNWDETKKGAPGKLGQAAKKEAKQTQAEQFVKTEDGAIARFKDNNAAAGMAGKLGIKKNPQLQHTPSQISQARKIMLQAGFDTSAFTDEQIDAVMDQYISFGN